MATPMSAHFRAGASFTPSPVMATTSPLELQRLDDLHLVVRRHPRRRRRSPQSPPPTGLRTSAPTRRPSDAPARAKESDLPSDRFRGHHMVAGDHDARGRRRAPSQWLPPLRGAADPACRGTREARGHVRRRRVSPTRAAPEGAVGHRKNAQPLRRHVVVRHSAPQQRPSRRASGPPVLQALLHTDR